MKNTKRIVESFEQFIEKRNLNEGFFSELKDRWSERENISNQIGRSWVTGMTVDGNKYPSNEPLISKNSDSDDEFVRYKELVTNTVEMMIDSGTGIETVIGQGVVDQSRTGGGFEYDITTSITFNDLSTLIFYGQGKNHIQNKKTIYDYPGVTTVHSGGIAYKINNLLHELVGKKFRGFSYTKFIEDVEMLVGRY
jgi:hypothetical protein